MMKLGGIGTSRAVPYFVGPGSPVSLISQGPERSETLEACCAQGIWLRILGGRHDWQILAVYCGILKVLSDTLIDIYTRIFDNLCKCECVSLYSLHVFFFLYTHIHCMSEDIHDHFRLLHAYIIISSRYTHLYIL